MGTSSSGLAFSTVSPHPGPGVQLTGGNRQIRTTGTAPRSRRDSGYRGVTATGVRDPVYLEISQLGNAFFRSATPASVI